MVGSNRPNPERLPTCGIWSALLNLVRARRAISGLTQTRSTER
nr:MAG TPA: hypothetical protein [Caudoviricetes sp.]